MRQMLIEIKNFFEEEKFYFYLLVVVVSLYTAIFFVNKTAREQQHVTDQPAKAEQTEMMPSPEVIERGLRQRPQLLKQVKLFALVSSGVFGVGVSLTFLAFGRWRARKSLIPESSRALHISWGVRELIKVGILFFWFGIVLNLILAILKILFLVDVDSFVLILVHTLIVDAIVVFFMAAAVKRSGSNFSDLFGFGTVPNLLREVWVGFYTYVAILPAFLSLLVMVVFIANQISYEPPPHPLVEIFLKEKPASPWVLVFSLLLACGLGPIVEEIFFRGFFYPALRKYWGTRWAMGVTAALFALVHENLFSFLPIFFLGLVLCYLYEKRKGILASISLHVLHNSAFIIYFFLMRSIVFPGAVG